MNIENTSDIPCWYAIHTKPKQEVRAENNLRAWKVQTFTPRVKERRYSHYRGETFSVKPLFPRYIFARFNASSLLHKVAFTRGIISVVSFGGDPTPVDDEVINIIQSQAAEDGLIRIGETFKSGDKVLIKDGPFSSLRGIFERNLKDTDRVMILLTTVKYQGRVAVPRESVKKVV